MPRPPLFRSPGVEASEDAESPARARVDAEARRKHRPLRVPVGVASAGQSGPGRLKLPGPPATDPGPGGHVLQHPQRPVGAEHPCGLRKPLLRIVHRAEDEARYDGVKGAIPEGEGLGSRLHEESAGSPLPGRIQKESVRVDGDHDPARRVQRQRPARPASDLEYRFPLPTARQRRPPPRQPRPIEHRHQGIVEGRALLDSARSQRTLRNLRTVSGPTSAV